ncbi:hypothetical protein INTERNEXUS_59 [Bacillus phage vB_BspM_Internexus]|nr:hypothetical protein INTERNEXUS_59 [Bacillus phage vB_BspM_Internexus]
MSNQWTKKIEIDVFDKEKFTIGNPYMIINNNPYKIGNEIYFGLLKKITSDELVFKGLDDDIFVSINDILDDNIKIINMTAINVSPQLFSPGQIFKVKSDIELNKEKILNNGSLIIIDSILLGSKGKDYYNIVIKSKGQITEEVSLPKDIFMEIIDKNSEKIKMMPSE